jgi:hypothetical protein
LTRRQHNSKSRWAERGKGGPWGVAFGTGGFVTLCVVLAYHVLTMGDKASPLGTGDAVDTPYRKTLAFEVCNGMANQRCARVLGVAGVGWGQGFNGMRMRMGRGARPPPPTPPTRGHPPPHSTQAVAAVRHGAGV